MTSTSFARRAASVHPALVLTASAAVAWVASSFWAGSNSPAEAKPPPVERKTPRAAPPPAAPFSFGNLPAQLPGRLDASPQVAQPAPSSVVGMSAPGPSGSDGGSGGSQSQKSRPDSARQSRQLQAEAEHAARRRMAEARHDVVMPSYGRSHPMMMATPAPAPVRVTPSYVPPQRMAGGYRPSFFGGFGGGHFGGGGRHR